MSTSDGKNKEYQNFEELARNVFRAKRPAPKPGDKPQDNPKPPQGKKEDA